MSRKEEHIKRVTAYIEAVKARGNPWKSAIEIGTSTITYQAFKYLGYSTRKGASQKLLQTPISVVVDEVMIHIGKMQYHQSITRKNNYIQGRYKIGGTVGDTEARDEFISMLTEAYGVNEWFTVEGGLHRWAESKGFYLRAFTRDGLIASKGRGPKTKYKVVK